jgi:hypothetical protein
MHHLELLSLLLRISVQEGTDEMVVAPASLSILLGCRSMMILSSSISVSARRSTADRSSHASEEGELRHSYLAGEPLVLTS